MAESKGIFVSALLTRPKPNEGKTPKTLVRFVIDTPEPLSPNVTAGMYVEQWEDASYFETVKHYKPGDRLVFGESIRPSMRGPVVAYTILRKA